MSASAAPRNAATLAVVRDSPGGMEVLLLRRKESRDHTSGAWVFPGGLLEPADQRCHPLCHGVDDASASALLGLARGGLDYYVAAIRECFEEAGLLFAVDANGRLVNLEGEPGERLAAMRRPLHGGTCEFAELCRDFGLRLAADRLFYIAHWLTPLGRAKRFDTRFFLAVLPHGQTSMHDEVETLEQVWLPPQDALSPENSRRLMTPTRAVIQLIGRFADTDALLAWARSPRQVKLVTPRLGVDSTGQRPVPPFDPAYAEIGRLDPQAQGSAWCEIRPGIAVRLSPRVLRVTAPSGHNTYLVGDKGGEWAVIDPGPDDERHLAAVIAAAPGPLRWVLLTRAAGSAAGQKLAARTGAQLRDPQGEAGATIALSPETTMRVISRTETSSTHYLLLEEKTLFPGAAASETAALSRRAPQGVEWIAPAEGFLQPGPQSGRAD